jgi:hypothetical protein
MKQNTVKKLALRTAIIVAVVILGVAVFIGWSIYAGIVSPPDA